MCHRCVLLHPCRCCGAVSVISGSGCWYIQDIQRITPCTASWLPQCGWYLRWVGPSKNSSALLGTLQIASPNNTCRALLPYIQCGQGSSSQQNQQIWGQAGWLTTLEPAAAMRDQAKESRAAATWSWSGRTMWGMRALLAGSYSVLKEN